MNKLVRVHVFTFSEANGGEELSLTTEYFNNGGGEIITNQKLSLQSYFNAAHFELVGAQLTSDNLRELANQLDREMIEAQADLKALDDEDSLCENYGGD